MLENHGQLADDDARAQRYPADDAENVEDGGEDDEDAEQDGRRACTRLCRSEGTPLRPLGAEGVEVRVFRERVRLDIIALERIFDAVVLGRERQGRVGARGRVGAYQTRL